MDKKKILLLSDHPLVPSGVGTQSKYLIEGLLATGKYKFVCLGGAMKHADYRPVRVDTEKYGEDGWLVIPVDGYGDKELLRKLLIAEKPDAVIMFTDPRFFVWVWEMEDEVRSVCPLLYWHVWDNDPAPKYNKVFYDSTDFVAALSLKTYGLLQDLDYKRFSYVPHAVNSEIFKPLSDELINTFRKERFGPHVDKKFIVFWNNRNARRKMTGDVIVSFSKFAERVGKKNVALAMHTMVGDPEGLNVIEVAKCFDIELCMLISELRIPPEEVNKFYNACDVTINIANNEGFGLSTLESITAGTPIIVQMTGGLQFLVGDWWKKITDFSDLDLLTKIARNKWEKSKKDWWGVPVFPASRSCTGSQPIPYIYDDRVNHEDVVLALLKMYNMPREERRSLGVRAREWANTNFSMEKMITGWDDIITQQTENFKSRKTFDVTDV